MTASEDNEEYGSLSKHLFQESYKMVVENPWSSKKLLSKSMYSRYHMELKHLSKQVVLVKYKLEKKIFAAATFEGLCLVSFRTE